MTKKKEKQLLCEDNLRHNEYYGMQSTIDNLYQASANGEVFTDLMSVILQRENILLAYRNIKKNTGSKTSGTDNLTIEDIGKCTPDEVVEKVRFIVNGSKHGYRPKPVRRKEIPKPYDPSKTRPLGIPCIWDRLVQQCIKQVMEPVCEAKFSNNSYGFRPNHSVENAIARSYQLLQHANLHYVIEFDIKGFFDNVNHGKLLKQMWTLGIRDKKLLSIISAMLKAEVAGIGFPEKGTPQGGIISPLLSNIVLNELDALANIDFASRTIKPIFRQLTMVRVGTSGGLQPFVPVGTYVAAGKSIGFDGVLYFYAGSEKVRDKAFESELMRQLKWKLSGIQPYVVSADPSLVKQITQDDIIRGVTIAANGFYGPQGRKLRLPLADPELNRKIEAFEFNDSRITNFEMESSALAGLSRLMGHKAMTVCMVIANRLIKEANTGYKNTIDTLIKTVLDRI